MHTRPCLTLVALVSATVVAQTAVRLPSSPRGDQGGASHVRAGQRGDGPTLSGTPYIAASATDEGTTPTGMALIPAGEFLMGDSFNEGGIYELPVHAVYVDAFYMDRYEVTNQQYADALNWARTQGNLITVTSGAIYKYNSGTSYPYCNTTTSSSYSRITWNGSTFGVVAGKENHPMVLVSWYGSAAYANWRSVMEGRTPNYDTTTWACDFAGNGYRLPTEAEWEKAARGGSAGRRFPWSDTDTIQHARANYYSSSNYSYDTSPTRGYHPAFSSGGYPYTSPAGYFAPNGYGLYDMAGNVWEWCNDWWGSGYYSISPYDNPRGPTSGSDRVLRGGWWNTRAYNQRCAVRNLGPPGSRSYYIGFRLALDSWAVLPNSQPQVGQDPQTGNKVSLEHLWQWSEPDGRFVDPGSAGVTINPNLPTYLLTHGWDGSLNGTSCVVLDRLCDTGNEPGCESARVGLATGCKPQRAVRLP